MPYVSVENYATLQGQSKNYSALLKENKLIKERVQSLEDDLDKALAHIEKQPSSVETNQVIAQLNDQLNEAHHVNVLVRQEARMYLQHLASYCATLQAAIQLAARNFEGES